MDKKISLPNYVQKALNLLEDKGFSAYIVGGCVRDNLMGITPYDWDICTSALPSEIAETFSDHKVIETGIKHGTVTVIIDSNNIEITTFRKDGEYGDHRRPDSVIFTAELAEDLARRDFTINAIAYNERDGIVDIFAGLNDLNSKIIRAVGVAENRFSEDSLRILRCVRFASVLGFTIEKNTERAMYNKCEDLTYTAPERQFVELKKLLCGKHVLNTMLRYKKVMFTLIPELKTCDECEQHNKYHIYNVYEHICRVVSAIDPEPVLRLSALFHDIGKPKAKRMIDGKERFRGHEYVSTDMLKEILTSFKSDNLTINRVTELVKNHSIYYNMTDKNIKKYLNKIGEQNFRDLQKLRLADACGKNLKFYQKSENQINTELAILDNIISSGACFDMSSLKINGKDLLNLGYPSGKNIGIILNDVLNKVISDKIVNDKDILIKYVKKMYKHGDKIS